MKKLLAASFVVALAAFVLGCGAQPAQETTEPAVEQPAVAEQAAPAPAMVEVTAEGTQFDPPVAAAQIPDGAWYCDMEGSVHYARLDQGDGKCPSCGMDLVQKVAAAPVEEAAPAAEPVPAEAETTAEQG